MRNKLPQIISLVAISTSSICASSAQNVELNSFEGVSPAVSEKLRELRRQAKFGTVDAKSAEFKKFEKEVAEQIEVLEKRKNLSPTEVTSLVKALSTLADIHSPALLSRRSNAQPDNVFKTANNYKIRALELLNKAKPDQQSRVINHRELLNWYLDRKRTKEVAAQTAILSKLLNSTDPLIINPNRRIICGTSRLVPDTALTVECGRG